MCRRATIAAALLLAALAACQLAAPAEARSMLGRKRQSQAEREAAQLAAQQAAQDELVAGQAEREAELLAQQAEAQFGSRNGPSDGSSDNGDGSSRSERKRGGKKKGGRRSEDKGSSQGDQSRQERQSGKKKGGRKQRRDNGGDVEAASVDRKSRRSGGRGSKGGAVRATYHYYGPLFETSSLYCADAFGSNPPNPSDRPWTAYCADAVLGAMSQDKCGKCLRVCNQATGDCTEMTVVDMCGTGGIDADPKGFNRIDGDGAGVRDGSMQVSVSWC